MMENPTALGGEHHSWGQCAWRCGSGQWGLWIKEGKARGELAQAVWDLPARPSRDKGETLPMNTSAPHQALAVNEGQE